MTEPKSPSGNHYEIEFRRAQREGDGWRWQSMVVFHANAAPALLMFDSLGEARTYVGRTEPGVMRIVLVDDEGGRQVVG